MNKGPQQRSELFTVRLWQEERGNQETIWRGKVQHVTSGEALYFQDWSTLQTFLLKRLGGPQATPEKD